MTFAKFIEEASSIKTQGKLTKFFEDNKHTFSATAWKALHLEITGRRADSGKEARDRIHLHYSDELLIVERVNQVKKMFS